MSARTKKPRPVVVAPPPSPAFEDVSDKLFREREARPPLKYSARLQSFHCFCGRSLPDTEGGAAPGATIRCDCGRGWIQEAR